MIPNYVGESLAALIPSVLSLAQGLGQNPGCHNVTYTNGSNFTYIELEPIPIVPFYPVEWYFRLMFLLLCISTGSFSFLNYSKTAIAARKPDAMSANLHSQTKKISPNGQEDPFDLKHDSDDSLIASKSDGLVKINESDDHTFNSTTTTQTNNNNSKTEKTILLSLIFILSFTYILKKLFFFCLFIYMFS
jgi:hypothetical protein